ncbi:hypothetical protein IWW39_000494 [Coemansia spiralis]|uniref:HMG box domain-containing protein n=1 Tax=Coemansia spiralis TaxID=417178 RepID=A0A9W8GKU2_9FUNG|nr:hypothetical protein IWW39_000494 [Coemansia spiralis]
MSSIASIISLETASMAAEQAVYSSGACSSRASSSDSFIFEQQSPMATPAPSETDDVANHSGRSTPALAALSATTTADATRRRKVLTSRPPNSFILYRSDKLRELVRLYPELKQTQISKMCADNWKNEAEEVKEAYRRKQQEAKALFLSEQAIEVERISGGNSDKGIIKRIQPTNTFIRYRTEMKKKLAAQFATMNQKDVSRACGLMWRSEPEYVKMRYRQSYNKEKRDFERLCTTTSALEPSEEALSALATIIASAQLSNTSASSPSACPVSAAPEKKRRLSEGCHSAPMSPPVTAVDAIKSATDGSATHRNKRPRSFHTPSRSESVFPQPAGAAISLPSCASLLSMADTSSASARHNMALAPMHLRHSSTAFAFEVEPSPAPLPVPRGAFDASAAAFHHKQHQQQHHQHQQLHTQYQHYRRVYHVAPTAPPPSSFHRYSMSGAELPLQSGAPIYSQPPPAPYYPSTSHYSVHQ